VTGLSMRTLFEAHEQTILVAEGIANIRGSRASIMTAGDPLAMIFQKLTRRRFRFGDAMLAKIDAAEAQMKADAERMAELEDALDEVQCRLETYTLCTGALEWERIADILRETKHEYMERLVRSIAEDAKNYELEDAIKALQEDAS
jgi:hypothetical protein